MRANLAALETLAVLEREQRAATGAEQQVLARWSSWGAVPEVFDEDRPEWEETRAQMRELLDGPAYAAARRTTINAHYTAAAYVSSIWEALEDLGFGGGRVLEPGCGSGTFIGMAPAGAQLTGVELDPATARIAAALYPDAAIRAESFASTRLPDGYFDAVVGNVPFADVRLHDPRHNGGRHSIHNHFLIKSLALTRPGGVVAVLTSRYTMDSQNPAARREMAQLGDLIGAVRLPTGAHRRAAGTEAVTDLLILRRREPGAGPAGAAGAGWETTGLAGVGGHQMRVNSYWDQHPEHVLGELTVGQGMYSSETLHVRGDLAATAPRLREALRSITAAAAARGQGFSPATPAQAAETGQAEVRQAAVVPAGLGLWDGHLGVQPDGTFTAVVSGVQEPVQVPVSQSLELQALLGLRDAARDLLAAEAATIEDTPGLAAQRAGLRTGYESYVQRYGPINRFTLRATGRMDPQTGEPRQARVAPRVMSIFRSDPFASLVMALENFDETSQTASAATLLTERVVVPRAPVLGADTPADALAISMDTHWRVDLDHIAQLLGVSRDEARAGLGDLVFDDPASGRLTTAAEYLSGDVRKKLQIAQAAAGQDPVLAVNVAALEAVQPADLGIEDVQARLGAAWIDAETHRQFLAEILNDSSIQVEHPGGSIWEVRGGRYSVAATSTWGTERLPAPAIVKATLEQRPIQVTDEVEGRRVMNPVETTAAQEKAAALQERFAEWVWEDPARAEALLGEYNRRFNNLVLRDYSSEGARLTLPGLARTWTPRPHQRTAVARMLAEPAVGLFHQVGAGKTAEMVIGTMELTRLGLAAKPAVVVPNHMLEQFSREWLQLYPQARLLAASSADLAGDKRRAFVARAATNDWDAVVMTRTAFERIPMSQAAQRGYVEAEVEGMRAMLEASRGAEGLSVKRLEKMVLAAQERLEAIVDNPGRDTGITFEETGIDYLVLDEFHDYKNLRTPSNIRDAAIEGSRRATDLHMKVENLRQRHGERVITAATATPIANSVTEAHVMMRYLRPDLLSEAGISDFDAWAATFGQTVTEIEMAPTGGGNYRQQTRFAKFQNVPELLRMVHVFADVKTAEDLALPAPDLQERPDGRRLPVTVVIEASEDTATYIQQLGDRAEMVRGRAVTPDVDNMLKISGDGRRAALDMRLVGYPKAPGTVTKLDVAADTIARIWRENRDRVYQDPATGQPSAVPGALQIVFCDLGTPSDGWNVYDELRDQLAARGLNREQIRFIHEAKNDTEKGRLFAAARAGQVSVIVGSTAKMGVGTNIQARAVALHHLDCPWRPADVEQRDGRILRQGNQHAEVGIYRYVTENSFDAYSWQTVERKAKFIAQIMRGRLDVREIEDVGDSALSFAEVKALASGDPLLLDKANADAERARLERLARAHERNQQLLRRTIGTGQAKAAAAAADLPLIQAAAQALTATSGDAFRMLVAGQHAATRADAAALLQAWAGQIHQIHPSVQLREERPLPDLGQLGGHTLQAGLRPELGRPPSVVVRLAGVPRTETAIGLEKLLAGGTEGIGAVRQLENRVADLPALAARVEREMSVAGREVSDAQAGLGQPFKHATALQDARARCEQVDAAMQASSQPVAASSGHDADGETGSAAVGDGGDREAAAAAGLARSAFPARASAGHRPTGSVPARAVPWMDRQQEPGAEK